ncbi:MAG: TIM barrel protein, partial [Rhodospirillales bacterium]|nr:TIM barrel protein [Rhodospirillales bacterium]
DEIGHPNLGLEYDAFHMHVTEGNMAETVQKYLPHIGNIQIADVPGRHEPGTGNIDYDAFLNALDKMEYSNWVACEYIPVRSTVDGLGWLQKWL